MSESVAATDSTITSLWEKHLEAEFAHKSPEEALATMTPNPRVTIVPTLIGGKGFEDLRNFYGKHFLNQLPPDLEVIPVSRTIGASRVVDELVLKFTHSIQMDWVLPGIPPTNKRIELAMVVVVHTEGDQISAENIYWDSATILRQAGLLPDLTLPVLGAESARYMLDPSGAQNELILRTLR